MNPLHKSVLKLASAPIWNMKVLYPFVRRAQKLRSARERSKSPERRFDTYDRQVYATDEQGRTREIKLRVFHPEQRKDERAVLFFHGGGFVLGDIDSYSPFCFSLADALGMEVYSAEYRLAPEYPYPAAFDDCFLLTRMAVEHPGFLGLKDRSRLILAGDSAGGELAMACSLRLREEGLPQAGQMILFYPSAWWDYSEHSPFASVHELGKDYGLTIDKLRAYLDLYVPDIRKRMDPYVAPLLATDFSGLAPVLLFTAELDPLRDEGEALGHCLEQAGNEVQRYRVKEAVHGYLTNGINIPLFEATLKKCRELLNPAKKPGKIKASSQEKTMLAAEEPVKERKAGCVRKAEKIAEKAKNFGDKTDATAAEANS